MYNIPWNERKRIATGPLCLSKPTNKEKTPQNTQQFFNREFSWLQFNQRVLEEAEDVTIPLLERVKFLTIYFTNLDEFFMVRVAGLKRALYEDLKTTDSPDDLSPSEVLDGVRSRIDQQFRKAYEICLSSLFPKLAEYSINLRNYQDLTKPQKRDLSRYFILSIFPVLTPLAVDPAHPFPFLANLRLYLLVSFYMDEDDQEDPALAFVEIPEVLPRLVELPTPGRSYQYVLLEDLISQNIHTLFLGHAPKDICLVRVTRDLDFSLLENEVVDLLQSVKKEVRDREQSQAVRLEISDNTPPNIVEFIENKLDLQPGDTYMIPGPLDLSHLKTLHDLPIPSLKVKPFNPRLPAQFKHRRSIFSLIREKDLLVHHPYDSFYAVIDFLNAAADDDKVLAIKQTLYRTTGDSPLIKALIRAAENGKQVTAVVELKARFDEKNNIIWARQMEHAGVNVVFGFVGLKTHAKATLVVRQEGGLLRRYSHLSTGNYNSFTAKSYVDLGLLTACHEIGQDISSLFNLLTGFNIFTATNRYGWKAPDLRILSLAPLNLRDKIISLIEEEIQNAKAGKKANIIAKMNALVDYDIITKLYEASESGVEIKLIVRGICCLKPGVKGMSSNISVVSIIDRFLEHSRIYYFHQNGEGATYLASADWMPRNMDRRVEIMFPIRETSLKERIQEILKIYISDNTKLRILSNNGNYHRKVHDGKSPPQRAQSLFINIARNLGIKSIPYDKAIQHRTLKSGSRPIFIRKTPAKISKSRKKKDSK